MHIYFSTFLIWRCLSMALSLILPIVRFCRMTSAAFR